MSASGHVPLGGLLPQLPLPQRLGTVSIRTMRIEPAEYERLRSWLMQMAPKVFSPDLLNAETDPIAVLDRIASKSLAKARSGLSMAIGDIVDFTSSWPESQVLKCNDELSHDGLPTLTEMQARFSKVVQRAVRRGRIKDDEEFYALRNAVAQPGADAAILWPMLDAYEVQDVSRGPHSRTDA
ncbi:hypothetical protein [Sphingobium sp. EM0848]|uniref:hypothetical protein n=1 Tax=Sphingobium sp. EM0848 TaxID=2743473 RepID=UPI00159C8E27|nr:hypothetical protein [Sphingobium sp. EM0848]